MDLGMRSVTHIHIFLYREELDIKRWFDTITTLEKLGSENYEFQIRLEWGETL